MFNIKKLYFSIEQLENVLKGQMTFTIASKIYIIYD